MDDGMIVELFLKRDETAIAEAASKYGAKLRSVAFRICGDGGMSEECEFRQGSGAVHSPAAFCRPFKHLNFGYCARARPVI